MTPDLLLAIARKNGSPKVEEFLDSVEYQFSLDYLWMRRKPSQDARAPNGTSAERAVRHSCDLSFRKSVRIGFQQRRQTGGYLVANLLHVFFGRILIQLILRQRDVIVQRDDGTITDAGGLVRGWLVQRLLLPRQIENSHIEQKPRAGRTASQQGAANAIQCVGLRKYPANQRARRRIATRGVPCVKAFLSSARTSVVAKKSISRRACADGRSVSS